MVKVLSFRFQQSLGPFATLLVEGLTYGVKKMWLAKCLKSPVSDNPRTSNMVNGLKHCINLNGSTLTIFIDHCEGNSVAKNLS